MTPAIRMERLSKEYRLGGRERYVALRDRLSLRALVAMFRRDGRRLWALKDVTLDVPPGEVLGLIGANGAGKTTLLKVLSRITRPTAGRAVVHGRVGSLLEVGAGFHPELTGRENVFLNGAILGMRRKEIARKFDDIVQFSEVEEFLDTPLKRYSSGMRVRLAFAVAAYLEPEILFVDEVLAVGDLRFQKRCLGRMDEVARGGRTIVFVSHQMNQIRRLCSRVVWLDGGSIREVGPTAETVGRYEAAMSSWKTEAPSALNDKACFVGWELVEPASAQPHVLGDGGPLRVRFHVRATRRVDVLRNGIALFDADGRLYWGAETQPFVLEPGAHDLDYSLPGLPLRPGSYFWKVSLHDDRGMVDLYDSVPPMLVTTEPLTHSSDEWAGMLNLPFEFAHHRRATEG